MLGPKSRLIVDSKQSGVTSATPRTHSVILPRIVDFITSALNLLAQKQANGEREALVADIVDAFRLPPLHKAERRFFVDRFRGNSYIFRAQHRVAVEALCHGALWQGS